jgi:hypothetical protein
MSMKQKRCPDFSVHAMNQWFTSNRWMPHCVQKTAAVKLDDALWNINKGMFYLLLDGKRDLALPRQLPLPVHLPHPAKSWVNGRGIACGWWVAFIIGAPARFSTAAFDRCFDYFEDRKGGMKCLTPVLQSFSNSEGADADDCMRIKLYATACSYSVCSARVRSHTAVLPRNWCAIVHSDTRPSSTHDSLTNTLPSGCL